MRLLRVNSTSRKLGNSIYLILAEVIIALIEPDFSLNSHSIIK
jgi:hypothetical protein